MIDIIVPPERRLALPSHYDLTQYFDHDVLCRCVGCKHPEVWEAKKKRSSTRYRRKKQLSRAAQRRPEAHPQDD